jgi:septal ring factor EnvC (AmiA/AmiB activator)
LSSDAYQRVQKERQETLKKEEKAAKDKAKEEKNKDKSKDSDSKENENNDKNNDSVFSVPKLQLKLPQFVQTIMMFIRLDLRNITLSVGICF